MRYPRLEASRPPWKAKSEATNSLVSKRDGITPGRGMSASKVQWPELSQLSFCSEFDKENSMEFSLISLPTYTLYYCGYALTLPWFSYYSSHMTPCDYDLWCDHLWPSITPIVTLWQSHVILSHTLPYSYKSKEKEKEKKRNINNNLAVLPSHDKGAIDWWDIIAKTRQELVWVCKFCQEWNFGGWRCRVIDKSIL